ncbi:hypothetical protein WG70_01920 [Burkholderia oklahomensis EO147]|nr:hypothetical protein WG70_01920 [Burkholderia oklahomensis EO147]AOI48219.1 hypothetical protein WI23_20230 [Burkholderia oklahomensis C6786]KUY48378.1 hypothetical protein WG70_01740 [Burkholderia oklahomensis EO147]KUY49911.1 hypothetical protein WI23_01740 [Burkholderia oklahomensis C6786]
MRRSSIGTIELRRGVARHEVPHCATASTKRSTCVARHAGQRVQTAGTAVRELGSHVIVRNPPFRFDDRID